MNHAPSIVFYTVLCSSVRCLEKKVTRAYYVVCESCAKRDGICAKCVEDKQIIQEYVYIVEHGSSVVERRTRNQVSPGSNPPLLPFLRLGIFVLSIDAPVDSAV